MRMEKELENEKKRRGKNCGKNFEEEEEKWSRWDFFEWEIFGGKVEEGNLN
jgi:hypothetical protein